MTEELKKQGGVDDAAAAGLVEETAAASTELDDAAKAAAEREARRQALYEENERAEDERARAEAERMRDVDDEDEDETPRDTWATVRRLWSEAAGDHWRFYIVFASIVFYVIFNTAAPAYSARVIDEVNVQIIMERMGGGGHLTMAGALLKHTSMEEAKRRLMEAIDGHLEARERSLAAQLQQNDTI